MQKYFKDMEIDKMYHPVYRTGHSMSYADTIYTFDIETSSMFYIDGEWREFDSSIEDYKKIEKRVCPYICMFGVNDKVFYFREISEFESLLKSISNPDLCKIIFVHNLSYEFEFLLPIVKKYTITNMIARQPRKPIAFRVEELNVEFRCSYMLTNLSLEKSAERYTNIRKKVGDLDYTKLRSPLTVMTDKELGYCEYDILTLYEIIKYFRNYYGHVKSIPLTQTGEIRHAFRKIVPKSHYSFTKKCIPDVFEMKSLMKAFQGGITHGNALYVKEYLKDVGSRDKSSSYPYSLCAFKYPVEKFKMIKSKDIDKYSDNEYAKLLYAEFFEIESKLYNHYISRHKVLQIENDVIDNGRIVKAKYLLMCVTDVDFDMICKSYKYKKVNIVDVMVAKKDYLPDYFIRFILGLYRDKTALKDVEEKKDFYNKQKQMLNGQYGVCATNIVKQNTVFDQGKWYCPVISDELIESKLDEMYCKKNLYVYSWGVWCTAYSRRELWTPIIDICDSDTVYYDTDSIKMLNFNKYDKYFEEKNKEMDRRLMLMCLKRNIPFEMTRPKDRKGMKHPLGWWENDGFYKEFVTLGSKRYCYRDKEDNLHITVSGVGKGAVKSLNNDIRNFNENTFFGYNDSGKLMSVYIDEQKPFTFTDVDGNNYTCTWGSGVVLMPTTYSMSMDFYFDIFLELVNEYSYQNPDYDKILQKVNEKKKGRNGRLISK